VAYQESVAGSTQTLDCLLPREALAAVRAGTDAASIGQRYLEPIAALQDDDLVLPEAAQFAYYAIYNVFQRYVRERKMDEWTIVNQALASAGTPDPGSVLSDVLREVV
jgi:sulfur relay (sulfurtransferase) DsrF/TusC family protein